MMGIAAARRLARGMETLPGFRQAGSALYERHFARAENANLFRGVYRDYATALASAPETKPQGYDHEEPAAMYDLRRKVLSPSDYPALFWISRLLRSERGVFDFGGHIGLLYYAFSRYMPMPADLRWTVCDVPAVCLRGAALAGQNGIDTLHFTDRFADCRGHDVLFASGSLQYLQPSLMEMLIEADVRPRHLLVNLTPMHDRHDYWTLQNISTAFCPYHIVVRDRFAGELTSLGYRVVDRWTNPDKRCLIPFHPDHSLSSYDGMLLSLPD